MERSRAVLLTLVCVLFTRISGAEVGKRVRPGDDVVLYSDCVLKAGTFIVWFRKSSDEDQTPLIISADVLIKPAFSRHQFIENPSINTRDLLVRNVSESDLGLYYCALWDRKSVKGVQRDVYLNGTRTTRLSLLDPPVPCADPHETPSTLQTPSICPISDCSVCWKLLVSVCPGCVLLTSVVFSACVLYICRKRTEGSRERRGPLTDSVLQVCGSGDHQCGSCMNGEFCFHTVVCYTSLKPELKSE